MLPPLAHKTSTTPRASGHHTRRHRQGELFGELRFPFLEQCLQRHPGDACRGRTLYGNGHVEAAVGAYK
jgi:hypothetical protein